MDDNDSRVRNFARGKYVIVRTYSAGVHFGVLVARVGREVVLEKHRRIWNWQGALTLNELALNGPARTSKISVEIPESLVEEAIEVIPCSDRAIEIIRGIRWTN